MQRQVTAAQRQSMLEQAASAPRRRVHELWHPTPEDAVHRLVVAVQPGSRFMPHQHPLQWEVLVLLEGRMDLLLFAADGTLQARHALHPGEVMQLPPGQHHALLAHTPSCFFEIKPGPLTPALFTEHFPAEQDDAAAGVLDWYQHAQPGERWLAVR